MSDFLRPRNPNRLSWPNKIALSVGLAALAACTLEPLVPTQIASSPEGPKPTPILPVDLPSATSPATAEIAASATFAPTVVFTPEATATPPSVGKEIPEYAIGKSLEAEFAGVGGFQGKDEVGLPNDPAVEQRVIDGYQFLMKDGVTGHELTINGIKRVEVPVIKDIAGEVNGETVKFTRPDLFTTGGVEYFNGDQKMVGRSWYKASDENAQFIGTAINPDGFLVAVYKLADGSLVDVSDNVMGPMGVEVPIVANPVTNLILVDGVVRWDANQPVVDEVPAIKEAHYEGFTVFLREGFDFDSRINVADRTAQTVLTLLFKSISEGQLKGLFGGDGQKVLDYVRSHNGGLPDNFLFASAYDFPGKPGFTSGEVRWDSSNQPAIKPNLNLPIELVPVFTRDQLNLLELPQEIKDNMVWGSNEYINYYGSLMWTADDGHLVVYSIDLTVGDELKTVRTQIKTKRDVELVDYLFTDRTPTLLLKTILLPGAYDANFPLRNNANYVAGGRVASLPKNTKHIFDITLLPGDIPDNLRTP